MQKQAAPEFCGISNGAPPMVLPDAGKALRALARNRLTPICVATCHRQFPCTKV
jgi:hypothetical protein